MNNDELIHRHVDGLLSAEESAQLSHLLETDAAARGRYLEIAGLHAALAADETLRLSVPVVRPAQESRSVRIRSIRQLAAGVMLGGLAVGTAWAIVQPRALRVAPLAVKAALADAGFEAGAPIPSSSVPSEPGQWTGDPCAIVEATGRVQPREGGRMLKVLSASNTGDFVGSKNMAADLWQVIALPGSGPRSVRVRAWFNADTAKQARFALAAVAGNDAAASAKELWDQRYNESAPLPFARTTMPVDHDPATWEAGELTLQVPPHARVLVIGIAAFRLSDEPANGWFPAQFVDDVSVSVSEEVLP